MLQGLVEGLVDVSMSLTKLSSRLEFFFCVYTNRPYTDHTDHTFVCFNVRSPVSMNPLKVTLTKTVSAQSVNNPTLIVRNWKSIFISFNFTIFIFSDLTDMAYEVFKEMLSEFLFGSVGSLFGIENRRTGNPGIFELIVGAIRKHTIQKKMGCPWSCLFVGDLYFFHGVQGTQFR